MALAPACQGIAGGIQCATAIRWRSVTADQPLPSRGQLEDQVRRLLERARRRRGASVQGMVETLGELQARGAETRRSWYDWQERPETVSSLTLLGAVHLLGPDEAMELLFGRTLDARDKPELRELQDQLAEVRQELALQRGVTAALQEQLQQLSAHFRQPSEAVEVPARQPAMDLDSIVLVVSDLEAEMAEVGRNLRRPWGSQAARPNADASHSNEEGLRQRVGTLMTRMLEVRKMLGLPDGPDYPSQPATTAETSELFEWLGHVTGMLRQAISEVQAHPWVVNRRGADQRPGDRRTGEGQG